MSVLANISKAFSPMSINVYKTIYIWDEIYENNLFVLYLYSVLWTVLELYIN